MSFGLNRAEVIGRLGADVTINHLQSGRRVANLSVATDESYIDRTGSGERIDKTEWHQVVRRLMKPGFFIAASLTVVALARVTARYASTSRLKRGPMGSRPMKSSRRSAVSRRGERPPSRTRTNDGLPKSRRPTLEGLSLRRSMNAVTEFRRC